MLISEVFTVEKYTDKRFTTNESFRKAFHKILLVEKGHGRIYLDNIPCDISDQSIYLISKDKPVAVDAFIPSGFLLQFDESFWQKTPLSANNCKDVLFNSCTDKHVLLPNKKDFEQLKELFDLIWRDFESPDYSNKPDALAAYLKVIIIKLANIHYLLKADTSSYDSKLFQKFVALIREQGSRMHKVDDFAAQLGVSTRKLSEVCKSKGQNAKKMILQHLVNEAKKELQFTSRAVKEIAIDLHFATPYQFSNFFKHQAGNSPSKYRDRFVKIGI